nr:unnamed protein product [Spirometra erinaceieuropaei]
MRYEKGRKSLEICLPFSENTIQKIDLAFNICFFMHFLARFIIADDCLFFWFELFSIVDILTIPPSFLALFLGRSWLGLRFSRCLIILALKDVLQYVNILRSSTAIRLCQLVTFFAGLVLSASGFVHMVENSGDPPDFDNPQDLSYFDCLYFSIVTLATVGYGDFTCGTITGRAFMIVFILVALAVFANAIPEIADIVNSRTKYGGTYVRRLGKPHLVLCGHITFNTVKNFLGDFLHKDREDVVTQIVILDQQEPNLELQGLLKRYENQVHFFQGSVMITKDLARVGLEIADACLVLANKYSNDPDAEDATNIMRVISIKNNCAHIKVIVQLMQYHNKTYLLNIPSWDWRRGDDAICVAELKLGFLAQNSLAPGFSTLLANLFTMRTYRRTDNLEPKWLNDYMEGAGMEMYTEVFSAAFEGMTFGAAAELCFIRLRLLLIAVSCKDSSDNNRIAINPGNNIIITSSTQGFFIAQSAEEAKRASFYCPRCHGNISEMRQIKQCACSKVHRAAMAAERSRISVSAVETPLLDNVFHPSFLSPVVMETGMKNRRLISVVNSTTAGANTVSAHMYLRNSHQGADSQAKRDKTRSSRRANSPCQSSMRTTLENLPLDMLATVKAALNEQKACRFDCTGMFHWCPEQPLQKCLLDADQPSNLTFSDHIVVCLFADHRSPLIGLRSFIMPLRASNLHSAEVKTVILLGNLEYIKREWKTLSNFPNIWVLPGSPLSRANLRAAKINFASMCVILSSKSDSTKEDLTLVDKEAILCSLNVKAMDFNDNYSLEELNQSRMPSVETRRTENPSGLNVTCGSGSIGSTSTSQTRPVDFNSLQRNRNLVQHLFQKSGSASLLPAEAESQVTFNRPPRFVSSTGHTIPMATELSFDMNVQFLDQEDEDDGSGELFMTQPFACGTAFTVSVLDSLMSTAYFNESALTLIRSLVTGGSTPYLEKMLSDGMACCVRFPKAVGERRVPGQDEGKCAACNYMADSDHA